MPAKTVGRLLLEEAVPPQIRRELPAVLDKDGLKKLFARLADLGPDAYRRSALALHRVGGQAAFESGGYSPGLDDLITPPGVEKVRTGLKTAVARILADRKLDPAERAAALQAAISRFGPTLTEALAAHTPDNAFTRQARSGAKGGPGNVQSLLAGDLAYADQNYKPIPFPILRSYGEGMDPHEYFAGTFGARQGVTLLKLGTAQGGYFCLDGATEVRMADWTKKPVRLIAAGDWVLGADRQGRARPVRVLGRSDNGPRACLAATFKATGVTGRYLARHRLVATAEHRVLIEGVGSAALLPVGGLVEGTRAVRPVLDDPTAEAVEDAFTLGGIWATAVQGALEVHLPATIARWERNSIARFLCGVLSVYLRRRHTRRHPRSTLTFLAAETSDAVAALLALAFGVGPVAAQAGYGGYRLAYAATADVADLDRLAEGVPTAGRESTVSLALESLESAGVCDTCDLEVDHPDHLFVLASGLVVANSKRLQNAAHRLMVTATDGPESAAVRGLPVALADPDNEGALLARAAGGYPRNTVLTPQVIADLHDQGVHDVLVRSPMVGGPPDGGVYGRDVGVRERGTVSPVGEYIGISAANAVAEPSTQALISSKHTGGVAGATTAQEGFPVLDRLISIPENFVGAATHARTDGTVKSVEAAPQGGKFITIGDEVHYAGPDRTIQVRPGQEVEAGDLLSDGTPNPQAFVEHKGIGEGRRRFVQAFLDAARAAGFRPHRRNLEVLARGLIDHVRLDAEHGPYTPGDIVSYQSLEHDYMPRPGAQETAPKQAVGRYLEAPVLHHTVGTRMTKSMAAELARHGVDRVTSHAQAPPFTPVMVRSHDVVNYDPDWMTRTLGTRVTSGFLESVHRGGETDLASTSFVPLVASGLVFKKPTPAAAAGQGV